MSSGSAALIRGLSLSLSIFRERSGHGSQNKQQRTRIVESVTNLRARVIVGGSISSLVPNVCVLTYLARVLTVRFTRVGIRIGRDDSTGTGTTLATLATTAQAQFPSESSSPNRRSISISGRLLPSPPESSDADISPSSRAT